MQLSMEDMIILNVNTRGVEYLENFITGEVIAKKCTACGGWKFAADFNKAGKGFGGLHSMCRGCHKLNGAGYRQSVKDEFQLEIERAEWERADIYFRGLHNW